MTAFRFACVAVVASLTLAACASAPISVSARSDSEFSQMTPAHGELARAANQLDETARDYGWIADESAMQAAMRWVGMGAEEREDSAAHPDTGIARYLDAHGMETLEDASLVLTLSAEMRLAYALASDVDAAALALVAVQGGTSRAALSRSLGHAESALTQTRDALALFDSLIAALPETTDTDQMAGLLIDRDLLVVRASALRERADELAQLRRDFQAPAGLS